MAQIPLRKLLVIAGVALLVGLAGCNTGANGTPTATGTNDATTDTAPEPLEEIDGEQLTNATAATIEEAGSYTLSQSGSFESSGPQGESSTDSNSTTRVDFEAERGIRETSQTFTNGNQTRELETSVYTDGDTSYRQRNSSQGVQYASQTGDGTGLSAIRTVNVTSFPQNYTAVTDGFEWEANGTETIDVKIPKGLTDGAKLRLRGRGQPSPTGGSRGDLMLTVRVAEHPYYRRDGLNLYVDVPISIDEAVFGTTVQVPTLEGKASLKIPAGTSSNRKLRLRGAGIENEKGQKGDLYAVSRIDVPDELTDEQREAFEPLRGNLPDPRRNVSW